MPTGVFRITDIPADQVERVIANYQLDAPENIQRIEQPNGKWTIIATFSGEGESEEGFSE